MGYRTNQSERAQGRTRRTSKDREISDKLPTDAEFRHMCLMRSAQRLDPAAGEAMLLLDLTALQNPLAA